MGTLLKFETSEGFVAKIEQTLVTVNHLLRRLETKTTQMNPSKVSKYKDLQSQMRVTLCINSVGGGDSSFLITGLVTPSSGCQV